MRPASRLAPEKTHGITPSSGFAKRLEAARASKAGEAAVLEAALSVLESPTGATPASGASVAALVEQLEAPASAQDVEALAQAAFGRPLAAVLKAASLTTEVEGACDLLIASKLASSSAGADLDALAAFVSGVDLLRRAGEASSKEQLLSLRALTISPELIAPPSSAVAAGAGAEASAPGGSPGAQTDSQIAAQADAQSAEAAALREAAEALAQTRVGDLEAKFEHSLLELSTGPSGAARSRRSASASRADATAGASGGQPQLIANQGSRSVLTMSDALVQRLPSLVQERLRALGVDPTTAPFLEVVEVVGRLMAQSSSTPRASRAGEMVRLGSRYYPSDEQGSTGPEELPTLSQGAREATPRRPLIRSIGIGDLLVVREHTNAYEGSDVAYIENVLRSERAERRTRRLESTSETTSVSSETTKSEERDTQTTDRFSLQSETSDTVKSDSQLKSGMSISASYGPMVQVKANLEAGTSTSTSDASKLATSYSKEVVSRSVQKVAQKVQQSRSVTTLAEFEEKNRHGFDNTTGTGNISGVYQWVERVSTAQIYSYGKRMLFDVVLPEPSAFYIYALKSQQAEAARVAKPPEMTITAADINEANYLEYGELYGAAALEPPPALYMIVEKAWAFSPSTSASTLLTQTDTITIEAGYEAFVWGLSAIDFVQEGMVTVTPPGSSTVIETWESGSFSILVGQQAFNLVKNEGTGWDLAGETAALSVSFIGKNVTEAAINVEVIVRRTAASYEAWRAKVYAAIFQAHEAQMQQYQAAIAEAQAQATVGVGGRSPEANAVVVRAELMKGCIQLLSPEQPDGVSAIAPNHLGYPELVPRTTVVQGNIARFFQEAFEWEQIVYLFYPYYWGGASTWVDRSLYEDVDPSFAEFLQAGSARVVFSVRPGYERAVIHYLETGEIWDNGEPPPVTSPMYVAAATEIAESEQAAGNELAQGEPWEVRLPTTLVRLRSDDSLPVWALDHTTGAWVETNPA
ncbi:MAG: hypothetical protein ACLQBY_03460 [Solirubrobacteraceae bacterium]